MERNTVFAEQRTKGDFPGNVEITKKARKLPRHVYRKGRAGYLYFIKRKLCFRLPDDPSSAEFAAAYEALCKEYAPPRPVKEDRRRKPRELPARKDLQKIFAYDPDVGELRWHSDGSLAEKPVSGGRYLGVNFMGNKWLSHRVIWKMMTGSEADSIDHINGNGHDNRMCNLRSVTPAENSRNRSLPPPKSGKHGVTRHRGKWKVTAGGRHVGVFEDYDQAVAARMRAEEALGYHENHGRPTGWQR